MLSLKTVSELVLLVPIWLGLYSDQNDIGPSIPSPEDCLYASGSLNTLITCLDAFTVSPDFYNASTYSAAQPTDEERIGWTEVVTSMLDTNSNDCSDIFLPSLLDGIYAVTPFVDSSSNKIFCILSETTASVYQNYTKGWGLMVVPASPSDISRDIHISAPHPQADMNTPQQAGAIFASSGAHSLLISGRFRSAYQTQTDCIIPSSPKTVYYKTDPAHDVNEPFNVANRVIRDWQNANGGCPSDSCAYVQMHGKGASTCRTDTAFISSGLGTSSSSLAWYNNTTFDVPARRLRDIARNTFPTSWNFSLPIDSPSCSLTATTNVFGRLINGIPEESVCTTGATAETATGDFIHIEQALISRESDAYELWGDVLKKTFQERAFVNSE